MTHTPCSPCILGIYQHANGALHGVSLSQLVDIVFHLTPVYADLGERGRALESVFWHTYFVLASPTRVLSKLFRKLHGYRHLKPADYVRYTGSSPSCSASQGCSIDAIIRKWIRAYYYEPYSEDFFQILLLIDRHLDHQLKACSPSLHVYYGKTVSLLRSAPAPARPVFLRSLMVMCDRRVLSPKVFARQLTLFMLRQLHLCNMVEFVYPDKRQYYNHVLTIHRKVGIGHPGTPLICRLADRLCHAADPLCALPGGPH